MKETTETNSTPQSPPNGVNTKKKVRTPARKKEPALVLHEQIVAANPDRDVTIKVGKDYSDNQVHIETRNSGTNKLIAGIALGITAAASLAGIALAIDKRRREMNRNEEPIEVTED
jgi:hypothetical protein